MKKIIGQKKKSRIIRMVGLIFPDRAGKSMQTTDEAYL